MPLIKSSFLFLLFFLSFFFIGSQTSLSQNITAQIGAYNSSNCQPGDTISIPVSVTTATGIGVSAISLAIQYDTTKLECLNYVTGLNQALSSAFISNCGSFNNLGASYTQSGRQFRVSWFQLNPVQLNGLAFNMNFRVLSPGNSSLTWDLQTPEVCGFYNDLAEEINQVTYQSGGVQCQYNPFSLQTQLVNLGTCSTLVGDTLDVPVILQNYSGVGITSISMAVDYDSTKLRCLPNVIGLQSMLNQNFISNSAWFNNLGPQANTAGSQFRAVWYQLNPVTLSDTLFKIRFVVKEPGTHAINFDLQTPGNCEYSDLNASVIPNTHWVNGSATASSLPQNLFQTDTLFLCGQSTTLMMPSGLGSYTWNTGDTTNAIVVRNSGWYGCEISNGLCLTEDSMFVSLISTSIVNNDTTICTGSRLEINLTSRYYVKSYEFIENQYYDYDDFEGGPGSSDDWIERNGVDPQIVSNTSYTGNYSLYFNNGWGRNFEFQTEFGQPYGGYFSEDYPYVSMAYKIPPGSYTSMLVHIAGLGWRGIAFTQGEQLGCYGPKVGTWNNNDTLVRNNQWHFKTVNLHDQLQQTLGTGNYKIESIIFHDACTTIPTQGEMWIDDFMITRHEPTSYSSVSWSNSDTTSSITVSPTQTTTYYVTVSNGIHSCVDSVTVNVIPNTLNPNLFAVDSMFHCGDSLNIQVGLGFDNYQWSTGDSSSSITVRRSGWYSCRVLLGICEVKDSIYVSLISDKIIHTNSPVCIGTPVTLRMTGNYSLGLRNGMIAQWAFNGEGNSVIGTGFLNDYEQIGYTSDRFGMEGRAASFNGINQYIQTSQPVLTTYSPYTISFWAQTNSSSDMEILGQACPSDCNINGQFYHDLRVQLNAGQCQGMGLSFKNESHFATAYTNTNDGQWHHYTMILGRNSNYSYSNIEFYRDGNILPVPCGHNWGGWQYMLPQVPTRIGAPLKGGTVPYVGKLDELVVWNRALSQAEINDVLSEQPVRYLWSTGDTTPSITVNPLHTTTYYVTITNGIHSCIDSATIQVAPNTLPVNFLVNDSIFVCGDSALLAAGLGFSRYQWSSGDTTNAIVVRNSGWYRCEISNGLCISEDSVFVSINDFYAEALDSVLCTGASTLLSIVGQSAPLINSQANFSVRLTVNMSQFLGPIASNGMRIGGNLGDVGGTINSLPMSWWNPTSPECAMQPIGDSLWTTEVVFPISALGSTVQFKFVNGNWGNNEGTANTSITDNGCGINDGFGNINRRISLQRGMDLIYCYDSCTNCDDSPAQQNIPAAIVWSTGDTTASITVSPTQTTTYYVTVSNGIHSCVDSVTVRVSPKIFVPDMAVCQGDTIDVPVIASQLDSVAAISLALNYNQQAMTYVGYTRLRPDMVSTSSIGTASGQVRLGWFGLSPLVSGGSDTLVYYRFVVNQPGGFSWNTQVQGDCELANLNLDILDYCFEGGQIRLLDTVSILSSSQGPWEVQVGDSIQLNVQSTGTLTNQWQRWNDQLGQWENLQDNGVYSGTSTPTLTFHCNTYQRPFPKFRLELTNGCRPSYGPEMPVTILQNIHVSIGQSTSCQGDTLDIPVLISGAREIGAVSLVMNFNTGSVQFLDWMNAAPQTGTNPWFVNQVGNEIRLAWYSLQSANIPDGQPLGVLRVIGMGTTSLNWDLLTPGNCEFGDEEATTIPASFTPGFLSVNPKPVVQLQASASAICPNGGTTTLSTIFDPNYTYQWFLNGQPLSSSQTSTLTTGQSGLYQVLVTTSLGCSQLSSVETIVNHPLPNPVITVIGSATTCDQPVTLNVNATQGNSLEFWWHLNGAPLSNSPGTQWIATQSGDYSVYAMDLNTQCIAWSSAVTVTIHSLPTATVSYNGSTTFCLGDSLALVANSGSGFVYQWTRNGQILAGSTNQNYTAYMGGDYAVTVTNAQGCSSTTSTIFLSTQNCNQVTGRLSYNNALNTALRNTKVYFQDSIGLPLDSTITNLAGDFSFSGFINGTYKIKSAPSLTWGGVNATDALGVVRHYTNYVLLQGFRLKAADVNGSNNVNNTDALLITRRYSNLVPQFNVGPWLSENPTVHANGYPIVSNIQALCYGDVNGSYNPIQTRIAPRVNLEEYGTIHPSGKCYKLPIYALENQEIGAISLAMVLPKGVVVKDVHSKINHGTMDFGQWEDELRIAWFSPNQFNANAGDVLFVLEVCSDMDSMSWGPTDLEVRGLSELADFWANPYDFARLGLPSVKSRSVSGDELVVWPNPAQGNTYVRWIFNEPTTLSSIRVLDAVGKEVYSEQFGWAGTGAKDLVLPSSEWAEGIYAIQAQWTTASGHTKTKSLLLRRK